MNPIQKTVPSETFKFLATLVFDFGFGPGLSGKKVRFFDQDGLLSMDSKTTVDLAQTL